MKTFFLRGSSVRSGTGNGPVFGHFSSIRRQRFQMSGSRVAGSY